MSTFIVGVPLILIIVVWGYKRLKKDPKKRVERLQKRGKHIMVFFRPEKST